MKKEGNMYATHSKKKFLYPKFSFALIACHLAFMDVCLCKINMPSEESVSFSKADSHLLSQKIADYIQQRTGAEDVRLKLDPSCAQFVNGLTEENLDVDEILIDQHRFRFSAKIYMVSNPKKPFIIKGRFLRTSKFPSVRYPISPGQVIQSGDLEWHTHEVSPSLKNAILNVEDLIEKTPRYQTLEPGKIIKVRDVQRPILVKKGEIVTLIYQKNGLTIQQQGKSMDEGGEGDTVRVQNKNSNKFIFGAVTSKKQVNVGPQQERSSQ